MRKPIIGVMGGGTSSLKIRKDAFDLGKLIAKKKWILLNGGRSTGVMDASAKGAKRFGGITVGILPDNSIQRASKYIDIPICTGVGEARNNINVLSSDIIIALPGKAGTISEIALALKNGKTVILLNNPLGSIFNEYIEKNLLFLSRTPQEAIKTVELILSKKK